MVKLWKARETIINVSNAITVNTTELLDTQVSATAIQANVKNVTITEPEGAVDIQNFLGDTTAGFQNAELDEKPFGMATITGTMTLPGDEVLTTWVGGSGEAVAATHHRYQVGDSSSGDTRVAAAFLVNLDDGTDEVNILLNNAKITKLGDKRIAGPDGHWEQDFTAVCLPKDYYVEFKD